MHNATLVRIIDCLGDLADYVYRLRCGHGRGSQRVFSINTVYVLHCDPQLALPLTTLMNRNDVGMIQRCGDIGLSDKPLPEIGIA